MFWNYRETGKKFTYFSTDDAVREDVFCFSVRYRVTPLSIQTGCKLRVNGLHYNMTKNKTLRNEMKFTV